MVLGVLSFLVYLNLNLFQKREILKKGLDLLKKELKQQQLKKEYFLKKLTQLKRESFLEKIAREDFNLKKEGERVVAFPIVKESLPKNEESETEEKESFWQKIFKKLKLKKNQPPVRQ